MLLIHNQNDLKNRRYLFGKVIIGNHVCVELPQKGNYHICCYSQQSLQNKDCISIKY